MIYEHFVATGIQMAILDYSGSFSIPLHGDDVEGFDTRLDEVLPVNPSGALGRCCGKLVLDAHTEVRATQNCTGIIRTKFFTT